MGVWALWILWALGPWGHPTAAAVGAVEPIAVTADARSMQPGELVLLSITTTAPASTVRVTAFGRALAPFQVSPLEWRVLVGVDLDTAAGRHTVAIDAVTPTRTEHLAHVMTIVAKQFPTRRLQVDNAFVNPPTAAQTRIQQDAEALSKAWASTAPARLWDGPFVAPVREVANSAFGSRSIFNGQPRSPHGGADFLSPAGTPIHAPNAGRVALAADLYYTGNTVIVDHGLGLMSLFAHLSAISVQPDQRVSTGDILGLVGATGRVTGAHLHWTLRVGSARVDPLSLLATMGRSR